MCTWTSFRPSYLDGDFDAATLDIFREDGTNRGAHLVNQQLRLVPSLVAVQL